ncbi:hypothetical protein, partial [uncultured Nitrospira sp.]|uniref:hypothetical protein n=1 Tax=uncultured Nitrospira sp. TaxID=157176 RepID=UPI00314075F5
FNSPSLTVRLKRTSHLTLSLEAVSQAMNQADFFTLIGVGPEKSESIRSVLGWQWYRRCD